MARNLIVEAAKRLASFPSGDQATIIAFAREMTGRNKASRAVIAEKLEATTAPVTQKMRRAPKKVKGRKPAPGNGTEQQLEAGEEVAEDEVTLDDVEDAE